MQHYVNRPDHIAVIEHACAECEVELRESSGLEMAYRAVIPHLQLADADATFSLWVFAFAPEGESDTHKHSNSTQITCTWRGQGRLRIGEPDCASPISPPLQSPEHDPERDWVIIPPGVFHHAQADATGWIVVSFQTVPAEELRSEPHSGKPYHYLP
jgi:quercetin dioxygenase-like cupin family protein